MKHRVLIVEDDPLIIGLIAEVMASLEHDFDTACSQEEAIRRMFEKDYSYILLDIAIPARSQNGFCRIQNTENLLERICERTGKRVPPIIILSDHAVEGLDTMAAMGLAMFLARNGAVDIIGKPFPTAGRTLDRVIKKVLGISNGNGLLKHGPAQITPPAREAGQDVEDVSKWLTVTEAANLLIHDLPGLDLPKGRSRISTAAGRNEFKFAGSRKDRRIEPHTFASWRLKQRDRDLDDEDGEDEAA